MPLLEPNATLDSRLLGGTYPFVWGSPDGTRFASTGSELLREHDAVRRLDVVALLSLLSFEYVCLDRTLIQGVQRAPWLGAVAHDGARTFHPAAAHGQRHASPRTIAAELLRALEAEIETATMGVDRVMLMLSGGMDSRVVAGVVRRLQGQGRLAARVEAATWGPPDCRDVVYANRIAARYGWRWTRIPLDSATYWDGFRRAAIELAAEVDPKHVHRMDWFSQLGEDTLVLAASYGDSIGRAEFGSRRLETLRPLVPNDRYAFIREPFIRQATHELHRDIDALPARHGERLAAGVRELERQGHYMRRQLCVVMSTMCKPTKFRQAFVAPEVYELMWSFRVEDRSDYVYAELLRMLDPGLLEIPWARTGLEYPRGLGTPDTFSKTYHQYGRWLRRDHADQLRELLFDGTLERLEALDVSQIRWMFGEWTKERVDEQTSLATQLSALAGLAIFAKAAALESPGIAVGSSRPTLRVIEGRVSQYLRRISRPGRMRATIAYRKLRALT